MTHDASRLLATLGVFVAYLLFCLGFVLRSWRARRAGGRLSGDATLVVFASQTGFAEELARATAAGLAAGGEAVEIVELGALSAETLIGRRALFVVSTTGEGDAPDGAARFVRSVMSERRNLSGLDAAVLALGDSSYADFCAFGRRLDAWLADSGARFLFDRIEVDAGDPAALAAWRETLARLNPAAEIASFETPPRAIWRLIERIHLNPSGAGDPAFLIRLAPSAPSDLAWQAGDVVEIERLFDGEPQHREYSIASIPADGVLDLVVRRHRRDDGSTGLMSGWLTETAEVGADVPLHIRSNRSFHAEGSGPMLLIGAGTGVAGLRSHIRARRAAGLTGAWMLFGERTRQHDFLLGEELEAQRADGVLSRLDLAFSREEGPRYVQDLLFARADAVREAVRQGAGLFVCGSRKGMGQGVHAALSDILGAEGLERLTEAGRYRRDIY